MKLLVSGSLMLACAVNGCDRSVAPCVAPEWVIVSDSSLGVLRMIDAAENCAEHRTALGGAIEGLALSTDEATAYVGIRTVDFRRELVAVETATGSLLWRKTLSDGVQPEEPNLGFLTAEVLATSLDDHLLYVWRGSSGSTQGVTVLDTRTRTAIAFSGPWNLVAGGVVSLPGGSGRPSGALALVGLRSAPGPRAGKSQVYLADPQSLAVIDSITPAAIEGEEDVWQVLPGQDGRTLYVAGSQKLARYDLVQRRTTASVAREGTGFLAFAPGGSSLVLTDVGTWPDTPGSGLLRLYNLDLKPVATIDISSPLNGTPGTATATRTGLAAASHVGRMVYVRSGSEERGPTYPAQRARLLAIDVEQRTVSRILELGGYGLGFLAIAAR